jgi:hypothetical protein
MSIMLKYKTRKQGACISIAGATAAVTSKPLKARSFFPLFFYRVKFGKVAFVGT